MQQQAAKVLLPKPFDVAFDYAFEQDLVVGDIVKVPLGPHKLWGMVWEVGATKVAKSKLRAVIEKSENAAINADLKILIEQAAHYNVAHLGMILSLCLSPMKALESVRHDKYFILNDTLPEFRKTKARDAVIEFMRNHKQPILSKDLSDNVKVSREVVSGLIKSEILVETEVKHTIKYNYPTKYPDFSYLNDEQQIASRQLQENTGVTVLEGVTGSGKTEVYLTAIADLIKQGKQVVILMPEIILTTNVIKRIKQRFGIEPDLWHSSLTESKRIKHYRNIANGTTKIIVGARSALFLPYKNLGAIIIDEEHDASYKQEDNVLYHARDMAVLRGKIENIPVILASASPSLETINNIQSGKYNHVIINKRYGKAIMPVIELVDMLQEKLEPGCWISDIMRLEIAKNLEAEEQTLLFLNRRGYAPLTICDGCGHRFECEFCTAWLVQHRQNWRLQCHHCGHTENVPNSCPKCGKENSIIAAGPGVERLAEEVSSLFPYADITLMTSDHINNADSAQELVEKIESGATNIIIGTQMVTKGHHFPNLTLVGVIDADAGLAGGDLRASEKTHHLLGQVAGRAGRAEKPGRVLIQTYQPTSNLMKSLLKLDHQDFVKEELDVRKLGHMPPFSRLIAVIISHHDEPATKSKAIDAVSDLRKLLGDYVQIYGPAPAPMTLLRGKYRYRLLIHAKKSYDIQSILKNWRKNFDIPSTMRLTIDVDPQRFV